MSSYTFERIINVNNEKIFVNIHDKLPNIMECVNINTGEYYTKTWDTDGIFDNNYMGRIEFSFYDNDVEDDWKEELWERALIREFGTNECEYILESEWIKLKNSIIENKIELFWTGTVNLDVFGEDWAKGGIWQ